MSVTTWRITKLVSPVIVVVAQSLGDWTKDRCYRPGKVTLWVAMGGYYDNILDSDKMENDLFVWTKHMH